LDGCKRIALDDNLAIALVFNTNKQMHINFEMTFVLYSENQEQWAVFRVLGHRKCFKKSRKMAKKSGKYIFKKGIVLTIVMLFYGFV
jgi:hypothetical protein